MTPVLLSLLSVSCTSNEPSTQDSEFSTTPVALNFEKVTGRVLLQDYDNYTVVDSDWSGPFVTEGQWAGSALAFPAERTLWLSSPCRRVDADSPADALPTGSGGPESIVLLVDGQSISLLPQDLGGGVQRYVWDVAQSEAALPEGPLAGMEVGVGGFEGALQVPRASIDALGVIAAVPDWEETGLVDLGAGSGLNLALELHWQTGEPEPNDWGGVVCMWGPDDLRRVDLADFGWSADRVATFTLEQSLSAVVSQGETDWLLVLSQRILLGRE